MSSQTVGVPDDRTEKMEWQVDEVIEILIQDAVELGERHSEMNVRAGRPIAPLAHRATTYWKAVEIIRTLQREVKELQEAYDKVNPA